MKYLILIFLIISTLNAKTYVATGGKNNPVHIISSKILEIAYQRAGLDFSPRFVQLNKSLELSNNGEVDGELARVKTINKEYKNLLIIPVSLISVQAIAFSKNKNIKIKSFNDLKNYNFTIIKGAKFIEKRTKDMKRNLVDNFQDAFDDLHNDKIEVIVVPKLAGLKALFFNNYYDIKAISEPLESLKLYHFVHKKNAHLIPILTPILKTMQETGEISYWHDSYLRSISPK